MTAGVAGTSHNAKATVGAVVDHARVVKLMWPQQ
jgi:hypothetical protein